MHWASAASMAPASSAARISSGVSTTLFSGVCWFVLFSSASVACTGGASGSSCSKLRGLRLQGGHMPFPAVQTQSRSLPRPLSSGCAASASGALIEKVKRRRQNRRCAPRFAASAVSSQFVPERFFHAVLQTFMNFYRDAALRKEGSISYSRIRFQYTPADKLPSIAAHCAVRRSDSCPRPRYQKMLQNRYVCSRQKHCTKPKIADISSKISVLSCCLDMCMVLYLTCSFCIESTILKQKGSFSCQM